MAQPDGAIIIDLQLQQDEFEKRLNQLEGKTSKFGSKLKIGLVAAATAISAAFIATLKNAVNAYAKYEQLVGGVETLFKNSSDRIVNYANEAYKTAGLSANQYMETVTSFSASLLQSLGGNTEKAADYANRAVIDMADNANKMGTNIEMIQNAYQGFAKQNYTMLDNLKLGYGGTKTEMQRLVKDAAKLESVQKELGITVDSNSLSFGNIVNAISVVQKNMGIMGTTSKEASETIEGSANAMKAAWENFLTGMADENANFDKLVKNLVESIVTYIKNIGPRIVQTIPTLARGLTQLFTALGSMIVAQAPTMINKGLDLMVKLSEGFIQGIPNVISGLLTMLQNLGDYLAENTPMFIDKGFEMLSNLVQGIINAIPVMIEQLPQVITTFANIINDNFPTILMKGAELLWQLITGILSAIPDLIANIPQIIEAIWSTIMAFNWLNLGKNIIDFLGNGIKSMFNFIKSNASGIAKNIWDALTHLPQTLWNLGKNMISKLGSAITNTTGTVGGAIKGVFNAIVNGIKSLPSKMLDIGSNIVKGLWNGIKNVTGWIKDKIGGFVDDIIGGIKSFFGIHSPSTVMRDMIGKYLPPGIAVGFELAMPKSMKSMGNDIDKMTNDMQKRIDMNMSDMSASAYLEGNVHVTKNKEITNSFPKSMKMEGGQDVYLVTADGTELAHWFAPYIDKELKFD